MKKIISFAFAMFLSCPAYALILSYSAGECIDPSKFDVTTPSGEIKSSTYVLITEEGEGFYQLVLRGGLPRISNTSSDVCIDSETSLGHVGFPTENNYLPRREVEIPATAYFDGRILTIFHSSIYSSREGSADFTGNYVKTSAFVPVSNTLFFEYLPEINSFKLIRLVRNSGFIMSTAASSPRDTYMEAIIPHAQPTQTIVIPNQEIIYKLW